MSSGAIVSCLKSILGKKNNEDQTGFLSGRYKQKYPNNLWYHVLHWKT